MVINDNHANGRAQIGVMAANAHAALHIDNAVTDDGGVIAPVLNHDPEAVGAIGQAGAVDVVIDNARVVAAAAEPPEALHENGAAAGVANVQLADVNVLAFGDLNGIGRHVARPPLHVQHEIAQVYMVGLTVGGNENGRIAGALIKDEDGVNAAAADDFVLHAGQADLPNNVAAGGNIDAANARMVNGILQPLGHGGPPAGVAEVGGFRRAGGKAQQTAAGPPFRLAHPVQPLCALFTGVGHGRAGHRYGT